MNTTDAFENLKQAIRNEVFDELRRGLDIWDNNLNEAGWRLIDEMNKCPKDLNMHGWLFNNAKAILREVIPVFLDGVQNDR